MRLPAAILLACPLVAAAFASDAPETNWPRFRGPGASGIAEGHKVPVSWSLDTRAGLAWRTPVPGLAHSSPVVWGDSVFLTTAVSASGAPPLKVGLYGDIEPVPTEPLHRYVVYRIDKRTGKVLWERVAHEGVPRRARHPKSTHANPTPATDGKRIVVFFGSEGLYCYDLDGRLLWKKDLGPLDAAFFQAPDAQWGVASSPVIHGGVAYLQCDVLNDPFLAAFDLATGKELWRTPRKDVPTWSTPLVHESGGRTVLVVNGWKHIGGYDAKTGQEIWKLRGGGDIPVPAPVVAHGLVFITNAHGPGSPIYAVKLGARGDITLAEGKTSNEHVAWSVTRGGGYMQTPLVYGENLVHLPRQRRAHVLPRANGRAALPGAARGRQLRLHGLPGRGGRQALLHERGRRRLRRARGRHLRAPREERPRRGHDGDPRHLGRKALLPHEGPPAGDWAVGAAEEAGAPGVTGAGGVAGASD